MSTARLARVSDSLWIAPHRVVGVEWGRIHGTWCVTLHLLDREPVRFQYPDEAAARLDCDRLVALVNGPAVEA